MRKITRLLTIIIVLVSLIIPPGKAQAADPPPESGLQSVPAREIVEPGLARAFEKSVSSGAKGSGEVLAFIIYNPVIDHVIYSDDGQTALLWLALHDPETGELIAAEPGLAIAKVDHSQKSLADGTQPWDITMQADINWEEAFNNLPAELMSDDMQLRYAEPDDALSKDVKTVYRGYKLPWAGGLSKRLSGSIGHFLIYNSCSETSCRYAYDFADGTMFPLLAARGGTVWKLNTTCPNYETSCFNYVILKDESTNPTTYQLYLHMAQNTVPQALRTIGASVVQGQFIGNADDTGASTGHHLHFHVHTNPNSYWGNSVDIRFDDVTINDGTPRTCDEVNRFPNYGTQCMRKIPGVTSSDNLFTSGNMGANPPSGDLLMPVHGQEINETSLLVGGWARDDLGIQKVQILAREMGKDWKVIGPDLSGTSFLGDINLCEAGVANGPVDIAARIYDLEGNIIPGGMTGVRTIVNNAACTQTQPPACVPTADQVALYSEANYQGICEKFGIGDYYSTASLRTLGDNNVESLMVGSNVRALLFDYDDGGGRSEAFEENDANLRDNRLNANMVSSMRVVTRSTQPVTPTIDTIFNDYSRPVLVESESYVINFSSVGATSFRGELRGPLNKDLAATKLSAWSVGSLLPGTYTVKIWGRNSAGEKEASRSFTISAANLSNNTLVNAPVTFDFQSGAQNWLGVPMWYLADVSFNSRSSKVWLFNDLYNPAAGSGNLGDPNIGGGDLTSPPIRIPSSGYYLKFEYYYETESFYPFWDQRWLQISVDGSPFENLLQLGMDADKAWLTSPIINLSAYSGKTIRLRFHLDIVDQYYNGGYGWFIDNVEISKTAPISCNDSEPNNNISQASTLAVGSQVSAFICPGGDVDYYRLNLTAGEQLTFDIDAKDIGSQLDPYIFLYDSQGRLILDNDDEEYAVRRDSKIYYSPSISDTYYLMVKAWDHPRAGSSSHFYTLKVSGSDLTPPIVQLESPKNAFIPKTAFTLRALATDIGTGIKKVDFYWRNADIRNSSWILLGSDSNGSDGWTATFDPVAYAPVLNGFLIAQAFDNNNNQNTSMRIISGFDTSTPSSQLAPLPATSGSTLIPLQWSGSDPDGTIDHYDLQYQVNGSSWTDLQTNILGSQTSLNYFGELGKNYGFRIRAIDNNNNIESYPNSAQASTSITTCTPDGFETTDNNASGASSLTKDASSQIHNFCGINDTDWVKMNVVAGTEYLFMISALGNTSAMKTQLYASNTTTLLKEANSSGYGQSVVYKYTPTSTQTVYLKITPLDGKLAGNDVRYSVWYGKGYEFYFPLIFR